LNPQPGIEALLNAMEDHPTIAEVQEKACGALWNLADNDDNQVRIAVQGGIKALLNTMEDHPTIAEVQEEACGALGNLAVNDDNQVKGKFGSKLR